MIDLKSISNMTNEEINEDTELKQELLNELSNVNISTSLNKNYNDMNTCELLDVYKLLKMFAN